MKVDPHIVPANFVDLTLDELTPGSAPVIP
jgi:hypothetical protein